MISWYVLDAATGSSRGPFTREQVEAMVADGRIRADTPVAPVGATAWIAAASDPALAGLFRSVPPISPDAVPPLASRGAIARGPYSLGAAFGLGWRSFTSQWTQWLLLGTVWIAVAMVLALPQWLTQGVGQAAQRGDDPGVRAMGGAVAAIGGCFGLLIQIFLGAPLFSGLLYAAAQIHDGQGQIGDLFQGFRRYGAAVVTGLLLLGTVVGCVLISSVPMLLVVLAAASTGGARGFVGPLAALGTGASLVIALVLIITVFMRIMHAAGIAVDPRFGALRPMQALRTSWDNTRGLALSLFLLFFATAILVALSVLLLCVGYFLVGIPLLCAVLGAGYVLVQRDRIGAPPSA